MRKLIVVSVLAFALSACAHKSYELCDTPGCGDNVTIEVEDK